MCVSVQRVYVPNQSVAEFSARLAQSAGALKVGDPLRGDTEVGPLIRPQEVARVHEWVTQAIQKGASRIVGGEPISDHTYACTVLQDPPLDATISRNEVFGPVVSVYGYDTIEAAIAQANDLPYAFQAAVYTADINRAFSAFRNLDASAVMVNDHTAFRIDSMPFAGLRESGLGIGGVPYTMEDMQTNKMLVMNAQSAS